MNHKKEPTSDWFFTNPGSAGLNPENLSELETLIPSQYRNINGIVVIHKGAVAFERYFNGFRPEDTHHVASVTKSVISALIGMAIDKGFIESIDRSVLDFFPEYLPDPSNILIRQITLRHLLTMTTPFLWHTGISGNEPLDRLRRQKKWVPYILSLMGRNGRLGDFQYCTAGIHVLSAILTRTTGLCAREFANENLFRPVGMREIPDHPTQSFGLEDIFGKKLTGWIADPEGNTVGGWGLTLTPRDMARFGTLYLNKGRWEGLQVIPEAWVRDSIVKNEAMYGYLWWLREETDLFAFSAMGSGGNIICCIPDKEMVVAIASGIVAKPKDRWPIIADYLIPAING
ncbi:MAG TPA: serine hydrolase [Thermotogota bacterium]|nr:serine hydrolase [Thermotogota bacterium]